MGAHLLMIADGRSPTTLSWLKHIQALGYQTSLISSFPCPQPENLQHFHVIPIAFSRFSTGNKKRSPSVSDSILHFRRWVHKFTPAFLSLRYLLGPLTLSRYAKTYVELVHQMKPDFVHALRIPFEGMLGRFTPPEVPLIAATWGNDLTLHAQGSFLMRRHTQRTLERADGLSSDTQRDIRLAHQWGLDHTAPTLVVPGSGGLDLEKIQSIQKATGEYYGIPPNKTWVVNPRGLRPGSVHQDVFLTALPTVLAEHPETVFVCPGLAGNQRAESRIRDLGLNNKVVLLPTLPQEKLWAVFKRSQIYISPSSHDGTPNTLLEAMACGCFPIAGDIESLREWITSGENGLLMNPRDPLALARAMIQALNNPNLRQRTIALNLAIIKERADQRATRPKINAFYQNFLSQ